MSLSKRLYESLYRARRAEEFIIRHYPEDEMKTPMHMSMGQEAVAVGLCSALGDENQILATYRSHAPYIAKTGETDRFFAELYGRVTGIAEGKGGSMHVCMPEKGHLGSSAIVGSNIPVALGVAYANKQKKNGSVVCTLFGDGALDEGCFWESINAACAMSLPVLFACEDNGFAVHTTPQVRQGYESITEVVSRFKCKVFKEDSSDVEKIYEVSRQAIESIRETGQPAFLHLKTYRYLEHVGINPDFDSGYRPESEYERWRLKDSVSLQRGRLLEQGVAEKEILALEQLIDRQIERSVQLAKDAPMPEPESLFKGVFFEEN